MNKYRSLIILLNLLLILLLFNYSVYKKEEVLRDGTFVLLELAPVDPRSLMQGDYMRLNYAISSRLDMDSTPHNGYCIVSLDSNKVAKRLRLQVNAMPVGKDEYAIRYWSSRWTIRLGAESYFFQEGKAEKYVAAKYGGLRLNGKGESVLIGLYDKYRRKL